MMISMLSFSCPKFLVYFKAICYLQLLNLSYTRVIYWQCPHFKAVCAFLANCLSVTSSLDPCFSYFARLY